MFLIDGIVFAKMNQDERGGVAHTQSRDTKKALGGHMIGSIVTRKTGVNMS